MKSRFFVILGFLGISGAIFAEESKKLDSQGRFFPRLMIYNVEQPEQAPAIVYLNEPAFFTDYELYFSKISSILPKPRNLDPLGELEEVESR